MKLYIKNMVCDRCIFVIADILQKHDLTPMQILLGEVDFGDEKITSQQLEAFRHDIESLGFGLIDNKKSRLIEKTKRAIIELIHGQQEIGQLKLSTFLGEKLHYDYNYLSNLFSAVEGITIEQYLINQKIEKVKELLVYDELSLTEIAYRLGYSSLSHLSGQFKKITGLSPSHFKKLKDARQRYPLDKV